MLTMDQLNSIIIAFLTVLSILVFHHMFGTWLKFKAEERARDYNHNKQMSEIKLDNEWKQKKIDHEHELLQQGQSNISEITKDCFKKVKSVDMNQAILGAYVLQNANTGKDMDPKVMEAFAANVCEPTVENPNLLKMESTKIKSLDWAPSEKSSLD